MMGKVWDGNRNIPVTVSRELINTIIKTSSLSGLHSLTIEDDEMLPLIKFQNQMLRRSIGSRKSTSVVALELILQITPLICDYHRNILSLLYNVWCTDSPFRTLSHAIINDKTKKTKFWISRVAELLDYYHLPEINDIFKLKPMKKSLFKKLITRRILIVHQNESISRLMRGKIYCYIYQDDFSFLRRQINPLLSSADTKREVAGMKISILHIIMEYPNNSNLTRIRAKKSKLCDICASKGIKVEDDSSHNLLNCICIKENDYAADLLDEIFKLAITMNESQIETFYQLRSSNSRALTLFLLNPTSSGNCEKLRINYDHPKIKMLFKMTQKDLKLVYE